MDSANTPLAVGSVHYRGDHQRRCRGKEQVHQRAGAACGGYARADVPDRGVPVPAAIRQQVAQRTRHRLSRSAHERQDPMMPRTAAAGSPLRRSEFQRLWIGLSISYFGDQFTVIALLWFVLQLTGSGAAVGLVILSFDLPGVVTGAMIGRMLYS